MADENFPRPALDTLRREGFEVAWISDGHAGVSDDEVLALCATQGRVLLTFDKDFGELAFKKGLPANCGIVLFRITPQSPEEIAGIAVAVIKEQPSWIGFFSVVTSKRIRMRPLPKTAER